MANALPTYTTVNTFGASATKVTPDTTTYANGYLPGAVFPAQHENYFLNGMTSNDNQFISQVNMLQSELLSLLTQYSISPNGTTIQLRDLIVAQLALKSNLASPTFTGTPSLPTGTTATTQSANDNSTKLATTAYANAILPIGTIIAFDANRTAGSSGGGTGGWTDNSTIVGWYACIAGNTATWGCPDLSGNSYLSGKVVAGSGTTFGSNSYSLSVAQLPSHNHGNSGGATITSAAQSLDHTHNIAGGNGSHAHAFPYWVFTGGGGAGGGSGGLNATNSPSTSSNSLPTFNTAGMSNAHTHDVTLTAQGSGTALENRPASYSIIWIRKCS